MKYTVLKFGRFDDLNTIFFCKAISPYYPLIFKEVLMAKKTGTKLFKAKCHTIQFFCLFDRKFPPEVLVAVSSYPKSRLKLTLCSICFILNLQLQIWWKQMINVHMFKYQTTHNIIKNLTISQYMGSRIFNPQNKR